MMSTLPLSQAYGLLLQEQRHNELSDLSNSTHGLSTESMAFAANRQRFPSNTFYFIQSHNSGNSRGYLNDRISGNKVIAGTKRGSHYFCTHCKVHGHNIDRCFKIHGFPTD